uniref:Reverse transcriptase domain-containing protein n=1 Tax=Cyprinus carpio carpio TaxID=630221 RepID=A0A9J7Y1L6_CYPCA
MISLQKFCNFFISKVTQIRAQISSNLTPNYQYANLCPSAFSNFQTISHSELLSIISNMNPTTCSFDAIPTKLLKDVLPSVLPSLLSIINSSLQMSSVPLCLKQAVVHPLLKKDNLDPSDFNNYRPISKLPFLHKVLEKCVLNQISPYLISNNILDPFQSGFRAKHSTESALLRVVNDLLLSADSGNCTILLLLDLSAAFDTVDHRILLKRLDIEVDFPLHFLHLNLLLKLIFFLRHMCNLILIIKLIL